MISEEVFTKELDDILKKQNMTKKERAAKIKALLGCEVSDRDLCLEYEMAKIQKKETIKSEDDEQITFVYQFRKLYPDAILYCVRNDGSRTPAEKNRQILMGVLAGVSDLVCPTYKIYIEMKRTKKYDHSDAQKAFELKAIAEGWHYILGIGSDDALAKVAGILNNGTVMQK